MILVKNLILNWTYRMRLPLKVRSTAFQLADKLDPFFQSFDYVKGYEKCVFIAKTCIFLGCKFEDIHGHLDKVMEQIEVKSNFRNMEKILEIETALIEFIQFDFYFTNIYQAALSVQLLLDGKMPIPWERTVECLNKALLATTLNMNHMEVVLSAFPKVYYSTLNYLYSEEDIEKIREAAAKVKYIKDAEIEEQFE